MDNNLNFEKYTLTRMVDDTIKLLNQAKTMIEVAKSSEELEKAKNYAEYATNGLEQQIKVYQKTKSR